MFVLYVKFLYTYCVLQFFEDRFMSILSSISFNLSHFTQAKQTEAYERDGKQQTFLASLLNNRCVLLDAQWARVRGPSSFRLGFYSGVLLITKIALPFIQCIISYIRRKIGCFNRIGDCISKTLKLVEIPIDKILNHSGTIINVACLSSYVAMLVLGHYVIGSLGLAGLVLFTIKKLGYLPGRLEKLLLPFELFSMVFSLAAAPQNIVLKIFSMITASLIISDYVAKNESLHQFLPKCLLGKAQRHEFQDSISIDDWTLKQETPFDVNYLSLLSEKLDEIIPSEDRAQLEQIDIKDLYIRLEGRAKKLNFEINQVGWDRIKQSVVNDRISDVRPINFDRGREVLQSILFRIAGERDEKFEMSMKELSEIGASCVEGWLREINFMMNPQTKTDFSWVVHHHLAVLRGELIKEAVRNISQSLKIKTQGEISLDIVGGDNNIHLINQIQRAVWHKWRPYEGEVATKLEGRGPFRRLLERVSGGPISFHQAQKVSGVFADALLAQSSIQLILPIPAYVLTASVSEKLVKEYNIDEITESLYQAIKPEYDNITLQPYRKIEWETITSWFGSLSIKGVDSIIMNEEGVYNPDIVGLDDRGSYFLSKDGVKLLLWDLGIIKPAV